MAEEPTAAPDVKRMRLRYAGTCARCGTELAARVTADYHRRTKTVTCVECPSSSHGDGAASEAPVKVEAAVPAETVEMPPAEAVVEPRPELAAVDGHGGTSALAEYHRRHDARRDRVMTRFPRAGRLLLAVFDDPQTTRAWSVGAKGERLLAGSLASIAGDTVRVLNDRQMPRSKANIDHVVVCASGVFVVDAKRYRNARPERRTEGGLFTPRTELLFVGGRNRTPLVAGMTRQVAQVRAALEADAPDVPVRGVLCFVEADWPLFADPFTVDDVTVMWPRRLRSVLTAPGPFDAEQIADLQWALHEAFPRHAQASPT